MEIEMNRTKGMIKQRLTLILAAVIGSQAAYGAEPTPLIHGHAHNDYMHTRPLFDALDQGFCSVEADIFLVDGKLLVAHTRQATKPERTLQALYLDPLRERIKKNGSRVYPNGPQFTLLIDLKTDWRTIYPVLRDVLKDYSDIFSSFRDDSKETKAITAIISGSRSLDMFAGDAVRYAAYDGQLSDLDSSAPANLIPWISGEWGATFHWTGQGDLKAEDRQRLKEIVAKAHQKGRQVRFWGAPDTAAFWSEMLGSGVDVINTDQLSGLRNFFEQKRK
jgi:hypothetical protein